MNTKKRWKIIVKIIEITGKGEKVAPGIVWEIGEFKPGAIKNIQQWIKAKIELRDQGQ